MLIPGLKFKFKLLICVVNSINFPVRNFRDFASLLTPNKDLDCN